MPCKLFHSAWHHFLRANCSDIYWASGALGRIRTADPQIRSLMLYPAELRALAGCPRVTSPWRHRQRRTYRPNQARATLPALQPPALQRPARRSGASDASRYFSHMSDARHCSASSALRSAGAGGRSLRRARRRSAATSAPSADITFGTAKPGGTGCDMRDRKGPAIASGFRVVSSS
jgi:hypothetical protein